MSKLEKARVLRREMLQTVAFMIETHTQREDLGALSTEANCANLLVQRLEIKKEETNQNLIELFEMMGIPQLQEAYKDVGDECPDSEKFINPFDIVAEAMPIAIENLQKKFVF